MTGVLRVGAEDGRLVVSLDEASVEMVEFGYSTDLLPSWVTDYLLVETLRDTLEEKIVEQIDTMVPPLLEDTLGGLDPVDEAEIDDVVAELGVDDDAQRLGDALDQGVGCGAHGAPRPAPTRTSRR